VDREAEREGLEAETDRRLAVDQAQPAHAVGLAVDRRDRAREEVLRVADDGLHRLRVAVGDVERQVRDLEAPKLANATARRPPTTPMA
jgi:hypothetical protein